MAAPVVAAGMFMLRWRTILKIMGGLLTVVISGSLALTLALMVLVSGAEDSASSAYGDEALPVAAGPGPWGGHRNGQIPVADMCPILGGTILLRCDGAKAFDKMSAAFEAQFAHPIGVAGGYRTLSRQHKLLASRGKWAAKPGTSNHGWGLAVDLSGTIGVFNTAEHAWIIANGPKFNWLHPNWARQGGSLPEPWHFEFAGVPPSLVRFDSEFGAAAAKAAQGQLGLPYVWGGGGSNGPTGGGFDCSGLIQYAIHQGSGGQLNLPRTAQTQGAAGVEVAYGLGSMIDLSLMQPGDGVAFNLNRRVGSAARAFDHIGLYIGNGQMIHAPRPGSTVSIVDLKTGYYAAKTWSVRRYG